MWIGSKWKTGYGQCGRQQPEQLAHRLAYRLFYGSIPEGLSVLHKCDNPICVNPDHLWLGTQADNMHDMKIKGRAKSGNNRKITKQQHEEIRKLMKRGASDIIGRQYGITGRRVRQIWKGTD